MPEKIAFQSNSRRLVGTYRIPDNPAGTVAGVVINHGYSGYKEEYDELAVALVYAGYATLQFDSRGCGESEAPLGRMMCGTEWAEDADAAITWISSRKEVDPSRIAFTGCSMGGVLTLRVAATDRRVKAAAAMAPFSDGRRMLESAWVGRRGAAAWDAFVAEIAADAVAVVRGETSRHVAVPYALCMLAEDEASYLEERQGNPELVIRVPLESVRSSFLMLRPIDWCPNIEIPLLLLHGTDDTIVSPEHAHEIVDALRGERELLLVDKAPHALPNCDQRSAVFAAIIRWFDRFV